jgi:translation initiation factor eIF-2B subunit delta
MFSEHRLGGSNARCVALLETFLQVIKDHQAPENDSFVRHIQKHLDPHIAYILDIRPISLNLRECIRRFKKLIAALVEINPPLSDREASAKLQDEISYFIRERIIVADKLIAQRALSKIDHDDVILTFSKTSLVESVLLNAHEKGVRFNVIVVDSRPLLEGKYRQ